MSGEQISPPEAIELEIEAVFRKYETRMKIAIERALRDMIRNGHFEVKAIIRDEQLNKIFREVVAESSRAAVGWLALASMFTGIKGSPFEDQADDIKSRVQQHHTRAVAKTEDWLVAMISRRLAA